MAYTRGRDKEIGYIFYVRNYQKLVFFGFFFFSVTAEVHSNNNAAIYKIIKLHSRGAYWHIKDPSKLFPLCYCWLATTQQAGMSPDVRASCDQMVQK